jgi:membrane dipeptidase
MRLVQRTCAVLVVFTAMASPVRAAERSPAEAEKVAQQVLVHTIIIDTHADTPQMMLDEGYDLADPKSPYMLSIPKMRQGHMGAEFMSIWVDTDWPQDDVVQRAVALIDVVKNQVAIHADVLELARTANDIERIHRQNRIAILMGVEGGHIIHDDLGTLENYYRLGARYLTLTHTRNTAWAGSSGEKAVPMGLNEFGRQVVQRMNQLGMMVDISHVSDKTFYDVIGATRAPVIASHSSCRALCDAPRNMTDDMIRTLAKNGGVIDINFYTAFLDPEFAAAHRKVADQMTAAVKAARTKAASEGKHLSYAEEVKIQRKFQSDIPLPSYTRIADHIDHAVKVGGVDHVGLGSDFDGVDSIPKGMEDVSRIPDLVRELARRGYSAEDLEKILGGNLLRVMRQVEEVSKTMQAEGGK